jgi:DNA-directed RNA polymerase subunit beta'
MSDPKGRIIELPIRSSFREGLSVLEYFISTHGGRKGLADTALRTADSGYLTRRLADVAQDVIVLFDDCGTGNGIWVREATDTTVQASLQDRIFSRHVAQAVVDPKTGEVLCDTNTPIDRVLAKKIVDAGVMEVFVRSPLTCEAARGLCQRCYGTSLATGDRAMQGEAAGIIAAQSIGEPGTQLTMRTFHTGGIAGQDITSGLPRVEELFEARNPRGMAVLTEIDGEVEVIETPDGREVKVSDVEEFSESVEIPASHKALVKTGDWVDVGTPILAAKKVTAGKAAAGKAAAGAKAGGKSAGKSKETAPALPEEITASVAGTVRVTKAAIQVTWEEREERVYPIPAAAHVAIRSGTRVTAGTALTSGPKSPQDILRIEGHEAVQTYLIGEVQGVYRSQGVRIHDKHIEVIIRQMLRKVRVDNPGDTDLLPGELIDRVEYEQRNAAILAEGGNPATASPVLLGVTRASLNTDSFLAAASFQETARVLTEAAVNGAVDRLLGLKENVIIGRLIPARMDRSEDGRKKLGIDKLGPRITGTLTGTTEAPPTFEEALKVLGATEADFGARAAAGAAALAGTGGRDDELAAAAAALRLRAAKDGDEEASAAAESLMKSTSGGDAAMMLNFDEDDEDDDEELEPEDEE